MIEISEAPMHFLPFMDFPVMALDDELEFAEMWDRALSGTVGLQPKLPLAEVQLLERQLELVPLVEISKEIHFLDKKEGKINWR